MDDIRDWRSSELVALVGAGASVPLGIPAMRGFFRNFKKRSQSGLTKKQKATCDLLTKKLGVQEDLEELLLAIDQIVEARRAPLFGLAEMSVTPVKTSKKRENFRAKYKGYSADMRDLRRSMLEFMAKKCFKFNRPQALTLLGDLLAELADLGCPVFTTNYDFVFESVARELGIPVYDNFCPQGNSLFWDDAIQFTQNGKGLTLVKLHGSVTWYQDDSGLIEKLELPVLLNTAGREVERLVIFPTRFKDICDRLYFPLYSHFLSALNAARCMILIGHSLRDEYLRAALIERLRRGNFDLLVIDPTFPEALDNELEAFKVISREQITHVPMKLEEFSVDLTRLIREHSASDLTAECKSVAESIRRAPSRLKILGRIGVLRPGQKCVCTARIRVHVPCTKQPGRLKVWLSTKYTHPQKGPTSQVSGAFLGHEYDERAFRGLVEEELPIEFTILDCEVWRLYAARVDLHVGIVTDYPQTPTQLRSYSILAEDVRPLRYQYKA